MWFCTSGVVSLLLPPEKGHVALVFWVRAAGVTLLSLATPDTWHGTMSYILSTKKSEIFWKSFLNMFEKFTLVGSWHFASKIQLCPRDARHTGESRGVISCQQSRWLLVYCDNHHWSLSRGRHRGNCRVTSALQRASGDVTRCIIIRKQKIGI